MKNLDDLRTELTDYIYFHQPQMLIGEERVKTEELIQDRANAAYEMMQTTENVPEAIQDAYTLLYEDLKFSAIDEIKDTLENSFFDYDIDFEDTNVLISIYTYLLSLIENYTFDDNYMNDTRYPQFRLDLEDKITNYIQHNGILKKVTF